jgi:hypothetical protein
MPGSILNNGSAWGQRVASTTLATWSLGAHAEALASQYSSGTQWEYLIEIGDTVFNYRWQIYTDNVANTLEFYSPETNAVVIASGSPTTWGYFRLVKSTSTSFALEYVAAGGSSFTTIASTTVSNANLANWNIFRAIVDAGTCSNAGIRSWRLHSPPLSQANQLLERASRTPVNTTDLYAAYADGDTPVAATWGNDTSGNSRHLTVTGTAVYDSGDPIASSGISATLLSFSSRSKTSGQLTSSGSAAAASRRNRTAAPATSSSATLTHQSQTNRAVRTVYAPSLGTSLPSLTARHRTAATTSAFTHAQQSGAHRSRWSSISASADSIVTLFTASVRTRVGLLGSALTASAITQRTLSRPSNEVTALSSARGSGHVSTRSSVVATFTGATHQSQITRHPRSASSSAQAAAVTTQTQRHRRTSVSGSADAFVSFFTARVRNRFSSLLSGTSTTITTQSQRSLWTPVAAESGAILAAIRTSITRSRFGSVSSALVAEVATGRSRVISGAAASAFSGAVQATRRTLRRFGSVVAGTHEPLFATLQSFANRLRFTTVTSGGSADNESPSTLARFTAKFPAPRRVAVFRAPRRTTKS